MESAKPGLIRVFISYSHDSVGHRDRVEQLAVRLRGDGIDVRTDRGSPAPVEGWARWSETELARARFVIVVCTAGYAERFSRGPGDPSGVTYESVLIRQELYESGGNTRFIPVVFDSDDQVVPQILRPYTRYRLPEQYGALLGHLTHQVPLLETPPRPRPAWPRMPWRVPALPAQYLPREELKALKALLLSGTNHLCIQGMPGVGKTLLAAALASDPAVISAFPGGVYWLTLGRAPEPTVALQKRLAARLEGAPVDIETPRAGKELLLELFGIRDTALLVLDDVWNAQDAEPFQVMKDSSRLLITTRNKATALGATVCELNELPTQAARELLAAHAGRPPDSLPAAARDIVHECGNLPLALAMAGSYLRGRPDDRWPTLLERLRQADLGRLAADLPDYREHRSMLAAIEVSAQDLPQEVRDRFADLAIFREDVAIPEHVLQLLWGRDGVEIADAQLTVDILVDRSLMRRDARGRLTIHALQHDYVRACSHDARARHGRLLAAYRGAAPGGALHMVEADGYFFEHAAGHLLAAEGPPALRTLLLDHRWLAVKLKETEVTSLLADFQLMEPGADEALRLLRDAIGLSAHVLSSHPEELPGQLLGRLCDSTNADLRALRDRLSEPTTGPSLIPLWTSLTPPGGSLVRVFETHARGMQAVAISADGNTAVSGWPDGTLRAWSVGTGEILVATDGSQEAWTHAVALSADGTTAVLAFWDQTLRVWDVATGTPWLKLTGHARAVTAIALSAGGKTAISKSVDTTLKVWDLRSGQPTHTLAGHEEPVTAMALSADGLTAVSGADDGTLTRWDVARGQSLGVVGRLQEAISAVALSADGRTAAACSHDEKVSIWDITSGQDQHTLEARALAVALSPDGRVLVSGSWDHTVKVWDTTSGRLLQTLHGHQAPVHAVALSADGKTVVSGAADRTVRVWDVSVRESAPVLRTHGSAVLALALRGDGKRAVTGARDGSLKVWNVETGQVLRTMVEQSAVRTVTLSAGGEIALSGSEDRRQLVWNVETGKVLRTFSGCQVVTLSADARMAVAASETLKVWDVATGVDLPASRPTSPAGSLPAEVHRGNKIGPYEVLFQLSMSAVAELFLCSTQGPGAVHRLAVVKRILPDATANDRYLKMFLDEARISSALHHPNIPEVLDLGGEGDGAYIAMEFVAGQNLKQISEACRVRKQLVPLGLSVSICRDVCDALHYAHTIKDSAGRESPIVHRDISPTNVMVSYEGVVKLLDFGIAKAPGSLGWTPQGLVKGTWGYLSPEQLRGEGLDGRSDVFCLGVVLFELLTGQRLFAAETELQQRERILGAPIPRPESLQKKIPPALADLVLRAVSRDRSARFATAHNMARALEDAAGQWMYDADNRAAFMRKLFPERIDAARHLLESASKGAPVPLEEALEEGLTVAKTAVADFEDRTVTRAGDGAAGQERRPSHGPMNDRASEVLVRTLALSRDGKTALSGTSYRTITVWDVATRAVLRVLAGHRGPVQAVALSSDGKLGLSGSDDGTLMVWDVATGQAVRTLEGHGGPVMAVALSEDGKTAVSGSDDRTLKVWDLEAGRQLASFSGEAAFRSVALDHSLGILAGDNAGRLHRLALRVPALARERSSGFGETFIRTIRRFLGGAGS